MKANVKALEINVAPVSWSYVLYSISTVEVKNNKLTPCVCARAYVRPR